MKSALIASIVASMLPALAETYAAELPTRESVSAQTSTPLGPRARTREEMEAAQTDGLGYTRGRRNRGDDWFEPMRFFEREEPARASAAPAAGGGFTEAAPIHDGPATRTSGGVVTGDGQTGSAQPTNGGSGRQGIVNAAGNSGSGSRGGHDSGKAKGIVNAAGGASGSPGRGGDAGRGKGIVNGWGGSSVYSGREGGNAPKGRGIVNAAGGGFGHQAAGGAGGGAGKGGPPIRPAGAGIVTGAGTAAAVSATTNAAGRGIVSAAGGPPGHAQGHGRGRGKH